MDKKTLIFLRGKPGAGKSTLLSKAGDTNFYLRDSDKIDKHSGEYKDFKPRSKKIYTEEFKIYSFNLHLVLRAINEGLNSIWANPWTYSSALDVTVRNIGFYTTPLGRLCWRLSLTELIKLLPIKVSIFEIVISNELSIARVKSRYSESEWLETQEKRLSKTLADYEKFRISEIPRMSVDGHMTIDNVYQAFLKYLF